MKSASIIISDDDRKLLTAGTTSTLPKSISGWRMSIIVYFLIYHLQFKHWCKHPPNEVCFGCCLIIIHNGYPLGHFTSKALRLASEKPSTVSDFLTMFWTVMKTSTLQMASSSINSQGNGKFFYWFPKVPIPVIMPPRLLFTSLPRQSGSCSRTANNHSKVSDTFSSGQQIKVVCLFWFVWNSR